MQILLVSPYHGGSHKAWAEGYAKFSQNHIDLLTLPDRFWKWRMHGGAVTLGRQFNASTLHPDIVLATDMLDLSTFISLTRQRLSSKKLILYMHENQLTYPLPQGRKTGPMRRQLGERDLHYAFINFASMLTADLIVFNSLFHLENFFGALPHFLKHFPEYNELDSIQSLRQKSHVLPVGIDFDQLGNIDSQHSNQMDEPLILWNQRWEYDKNPDDFFKALFKIKAQGLRFKLAVCGQQFGKRPFIFEQAETLLSDHLVHFGFADAGTYQRLLQQANIVVSTAVHEFFGVSILEAVGCNTWPILPNRLSYPDLFPKEFHTNIFYNDFQQLVEQMAFAIENQDALNKIRINLAGHVQQFHWKFVAKRYDTLFALGSNEV